MSVSHSSSGSFSNEEDEEEEFFDAKSTDDEKEVFVDNYAEEDDGSENAHKLTSSGKENEAALTNDNNEDKDELNCHPIPPPRRKKKLLSKPSITVENYDSPPDGKTANLTQLVADIVSIQGDLSVNEAILSQNEERKSVSIDELQNESKTKESTDSPPVSKPAAESTVLEQVMVRNIDTGECIPLSKVDDYLPKCINPLNHHLMKRTKDYETDEEEEEGGTLPEEIAMSDQLSIATDQDTSTLSKREQLKSKVKKFGHGIIRGVKIVKKEQSGATEPKPGLVAEQEPHNVFKLKVNRKKGSADFDGLRLIQELNDCKGAIWCMKWSVCGQLLAVAGQDQLLRVYCGYKAWKYFTQLRSKASGQQTSPNSTKDRSFSGSRNNSISSSDNVSFDGMNSASSRTWIEDNTLSEEGPLLLFSAYRAHTADVLDISWSKNHFLLSSSMDKTVRLWHITRVECLCTFRHIDFVTTIQFHPRDDRYFLSGSLDGKLRLWNIPDKKVTLWNEVTALPVQNRGHNKNNQPSTPAHGLITSSAFVQNGKFAVIGTYDGRVIFYSTDQLKYSTQIHVSGGKNLNNRTEMVSTSSGNQGKRKRNNNKVTGIEGVDDTKILVTTNDSRIRLYDLRDLSLACKYKGCVNYSSQIKASVSHDNKYIVCGSENSSFYIWRLQENTTIGQRRDRNQQWECVKLSPGTHSSLQPYQTNTTTPARNLPGIITSATFAPSPNLLDDNAKYIIAIADFSGSIKLFMKSVQ